MSDFQRSLQFQGRNLQRQWQEKPLLRMAIWSLCLLLVVHLVMLSMDWREERGEEYRRLAGEWLKLQDVSRQTAWPERAMQAKQVLNLQRERFWQAPNASQARADVQAWLTERVRLAGVPDAEVSVLLPRGFEARDDRAYRGPGSRAVAASLVQSVVAGYRSGAATSIGGVSGTEQYVVAHAQSTIVVPVRSGLLKRMRIGQHPFAGRVRRRAVPFDGASCRQAAGKPNPLGTPAIRLPGPPLSHSRSEERPVWSGL